MTAPRGEDKGLSSMMLLRHNSGKRPLVTGSRSVVACGGEDGDWRAGEVAEGRGGLLGVMDMSTVWTIVMVSQARM